MYTAEQVDILITELKKKGLQNAEIVWKVAEACIGWPYVFGALGELCTPAVRRKYYTNYSTSKPAEAAQIMKRCQVLNGSRSSCDGCPYHPGGTTRCFDCRGFTRWVLARIGIKLNGGGCTSQWNDNSNWTEKGLIGDLPAGQLACFFHQNQSDTKTMEHTGFILDNTTVHCSGTVKKEKPSRYITHYAIPKGLEGMTPETRPTLRRGSSGEWVTYLQAKLIQLGYDVGSTGADGKFGAKTETAVKAFQKDRGLTADGVVGQKTWAAIDSGVAVTYTVTVQHLSKSVAEDIIKVYGGTMTKEGDDA